MNSTSYRYGYNGQEKSLEIDGSGNHNTAEYWEVDNRILRRWNLDPVVYEWRSGYSLFNNNPIALNDPLGLAGEDSNTETDDGDGGERLQSSKDKTSNPPNGNAKDNSQGTATVEIKPQDQKTGNNVQSTNASDNTQTQIAVKAVKSKEQNINQPATFLGSTASQWESEIPIWGPCKNANYFFDKGDYLNGTAWFGMGVLDAFTLGAVYKYYKATQIGTKLAFRVVAEEAVSMKSSTSLYFGPSYSAVAEVSVPATGERALKIANKLSNNKGTWQKIYEAGIRDGKKIEVHYFRNSTTDQIFDIKVKYNEWHQKAFKKLLEVK